MNETLVCVVGNVATQPVCRELSTGSSARFRLAVTSRYWDREKNEWTDGHTNFFTVWARRTLAANVASSVALGDPVVVQGRLKVRTEQRDGQSRVSADVDAVAIGHDLSRGTSAFRRTPRGEASAVTQSQSHSQPEPEPNWETPQPGSRLDTTAERQPEPAGVT
ncbi:single-stranded DNA-binding protein [Streptomyces sp. NPDC001868]|uniref:single-stranded DNA-binding protein n=1 Tax=Streptomyces sp. NPDC001868 TaxID=3154401 RepID=UPI003325AFFF